MSQLKVGAKAPKFSLPDQTGKPVSLSSFKGKNLLIYFYPKADTPGCTKQSCSVRDSLASLRGQGIEVVGISPDKPEDQEKFDKKFTLGFPLLGDEDHAIAEAYGVWGQKSMYGKTYMGIIRSAFLVDETGKLAHAWYKVSPDDTVPNVLKALGVA